jgi:uncharacterized protein YndB with AHSA1/START domain
MKSEIGIDDNSLRVTRVFNAPRPLVFSWWTTAEKYRQWSGCKEATRCEVAMDFRVGGSFTQKMQIAAPEGPCEFIVGGTYTEIVEPERIGYDATFGSAPVRVTVDFFEQGKGTRVVVTHEGCPDEFFGRNVARGTTESLDKLDPLVASRVEAAFL